MATEFKITEETRQYKLVCYKDSDEAADALRQLAEVVEVTGMVPRNLSIQKTGDNLTINATLENKFPDT